MIIFSLIFIGTNGFFKNQMVFNPHLLKMWSKSGLFAQKFFLFQKMGKNRKKWSKIVHFFKLKKYIFLTYIQHRFFLHIFDGLKMIFFPYIFLEPVGTYEFCLHFYTIFKIVTSIERILATL
jgi:hypothetical protein